jgi:nanoRNase/pAp phosphatase (c-di-AMP/oligoRNAs hydrolase)
MIDFPELKKIFATSQNILLCTNGSRKTRDCFSASFSLFYTLKKIGKVVNFYPNDLLSEATSFPFPLKKIKNFALIIKNPDLLTGIYYKKNPAEIELFLTTKGAPIKPEDVRFVPLEEFKSKEPDLVIALGINSLEDLGEFYEKNFKIFFQVPIINIDNQSNNQEFGKINLVEKRPLSYLSALLINSVAKDGLDKYSATSIFLGILDFYKNKTVDEEILEMLVYLKEKGVDFQKISQVLLKKSSEQERHLFELIFKNMDYSKKLSLPFILLKKKDLFSFNLQEKDLASGIKFLRGELFFSPSSLILWEVHSSEKFIKGVFYSPNKSLVKKLAHNFGGEVAGNRALFSLKDINVISAREKIFSLLYGKNH